MSKIAVNSPATGSATFTLTAPGGTSTDRTLTLPDAAGTIQVSGSPISGTTGTFTGLVDISAAGAGQIQFPATQVPSSNANTLDDYEEGTFTPVLTGSTSGTFNGSGKYTKIGDVVNVYMQFTSITTANKPIGDYTITGLPFTSRATVPDSIPLTIGGIARVTFDASKILVASMASSATIVTLGELVTNGLATAVTDANFLNGSTMFFRISGSYPTST